MGLHGGERKICPHLGKESQESQFSLPSVLRTNKSDASQKPSSRIYRLKSLDNSSTQLKLSDSPFIFRRSLAYQPLEDTYELKRESIYKNSKSVKKLNELGNCDERKKLVDSLCRTSLNEDIFSQKKTLESSLSTRSCSSYRETEEFLELSFYPKKDGLNASEFGLEPLIEVDDSSGGLLEFQLHREDQECNLEKLASDFKGCDSVEGTNLRCDKTSIPKIGHSSLSESDSILTLEKVLSTKVGRPKSSGHLSSNYSKSSPKSRFNTLNKILHPFIRSKSERNPSLLMKNMNTYKSLGPASIGRCRTVGTSFHGDLSYVANKEVVDGFSTSKKQGSNARCFSPTQLHGVLQLEKKHGLPFYKFSSKNPKDIIVSRIWKRDDEAFSWAYTFHSANTNNKSNDGRWIQKERCEKFSMIGQMKVTSYISLEMKNCLSLDNSILTEFVLYDTSQVRRHNAEENKDLNTNAASFESNDGLYPYPSVVPSELQCHLEIVAITIHTPFTKTVGTPGSMDLYDSSKIGRRFPSTENSINPGLVKVVASRGTHGLPNEEKGSPSSLLDRWRSGGGCDCGGWDVSCPVAVFVNHGSGNVIDHRLGENQRCFQLFLQGTKDKLPAVSVTALEEGQYSVDFHAELSTLQTFAICVSILHNKEVSDAHFEEKSNQKIESNSLKVLLQKDMKCLIEVVSDETLKVTKKMEDIPTSFLFKPPFFSIGREEKQKDMKIVEENPSSFLLDPPFSPIGRL